MTWTLQAAGTAAAPLEEKVLSAGGNYDEPGDGICNLRGKLNDTAVVEAGEVELVDLATGVECGKCRSALELADNVDGSVAKRSVSPGGHVNQPRSNVLQTGVRSDTRLQGGSCANDGGEIDAWVAKAHVWSGDFIEDNSRDASKVIELRTFVSGLTTSDYQVEHTLALRLVRFLQTGFGLGVYFGGCL